MLVRIFSPFRRSINFLKRNFNRTVPVGTALEHRNMSFSRGVTLGRSPSLVEGNNRSNKAPILFRARRFYLTPGLMMNLSPGFSRNYATQPKIEDKERSENAHLEIRKVLEFAKDYKQKASASNNLNRRKLLELYGFALNLARRVASVQSKSLETEIVEIIKMFLWEELRIKQDVAVANLPQSMNLFKEKLKNIRLNFLTKKISPETVSESLRENSRATEELVQWMFQQVKDLLGEPPCRFTMVSMGSLGSGTASPYSDVEYFILVESSVQKNRNYFQNFCDVFDFLMIGFGESPIYEASDLLNSESTLAEVYKRFKKGVRVDEHKKPQDFNRLLGLITTGRELLERLPHDIIHQPGNHLTAALFSTQYLWGDRGLFEEYQKLFAVALGSREYLDCIQKVLRQDINAAKAQHLFLANRILEKSKEPFELKPLLTACVQLAKGLATLLKVRGKQVHLKQHSLDTLTELRIGEHISKEQHEKWQRLIQGLFARRLILQQEDQSAEAKINLEALDQAMHLDTLSIGIKVITEIVDTELNRSSQFKALPSIKDVLQSEVKVLGDVPRQDNIFVSRKTLLEDLQKKLKVDGKEENASTKVLVCVGLGGVGKTQFLLNYFRNPKQPYAYKAWFRVENIVALEQSYRAMAKAWGFLDEQASIKDIIQYVKRYLSEHSGWLFVYDNVNSYGEIEPFLPETGGVVILSTRHQRWPETFERLPIPVMSPIEALEMIQALSSRKIEGELKEAEELVKVLDYLPLALAQASTYIKETQPPITIAAYLELYKKWEAELLAEDTLPQVGKQVRSLPVAITWNITLEAILEKEKGRPTPLLALELLTVCSYLARNKIPKKYLLTWLKLAYRDLEQPELHLNHCLMILEQYSMMEYQEEACVAVHRLVQSVLRAQQKNINLKKRLPYPALKVEWYQILLEASIEECNRDPEVLERERGRMQLLPHLQSLIKYYDELWNKEKPSPVLAIVLENIGIVLTILGNSSFSKLYFEKALKIKETCYGKEDWQVAKILNNLGIAHHDLGEIQQAKVLFERALKIKETCYGKEDWQVAKILNNLGTVHHDLGEIQQAQVLFERALKIALIYKKEDWQIAKILNNLGAAHHDLGEIQQAKVLFERALKIEEVGCGKAYWEVARTLNNVGAIHHDLGDVPQAKALYEEALKNKETHFGKEHRELVATLNNLGRAHHDLGEVQQAKIVQERVSKILSQSSQSPLPVQLANRISSGLTIELKSLFYGARQSQEVTTVAALVPQFEATHSELSKSKRKILTLYQVAESGSETVLKQLLEHPKDLDINELNSNSGRNALHAAILNRRKDAIEVLIQAGAKRDIPDRQGKTALTYALESGDQEIIALLQAKKSSNQPKK